MKLNRTKDFCCEEIIYIMIKYRGISLVSFAHIARWWLFEQLVEKFYSRPLLLAKSKSIEKLLKLYLIKKFEEKYVDTIIVIKDYARYSVFKEYTRYSMYSIKSQCVLNLALVTAFLKLFQLQICS